MKRKRKGNTNENENKMAPVLPEDFFWAAGWPHET